MEDAFTTEQLYAAYKPLLFSLAYRMLGSVMDAEDIVQEAFLAMNGAAPGSIRNPKSYLCRIVTNRCIDLLRSAQHQREVYVGPWLPEPLVAAPDDRADPSERYALRESLSTAYLLLLQQLSSIERAVFLLREVLQYDYDEIADVVGKSSANCRQIFHRAKRGIGHYMEDAAERSDLRPAVTEQSSTVVERFVQALTSGDVGALLGMLSEDAALYSDGGGKVTAAVRPVVGAERIVRFMIGVLAKLPAGFSYRWATVGGGPGIVAYVNGHTYTVFSFDCEGGRISSVYIVLNPDKLRHVK